MKPAIIVLAYNRPKSLQRLLNSLAGAEYPGVEKLIISLESGSTPEVVDTAFSFESSKLDTEVVQCKKKLGLRNHVIACGDLSDKFGSVIVLEDDLLVDPYFYLYAADALDFYLKNEAVAGIALYSYQRNELSNLPFSAMYNGYSTFPMQVPCSWGQCWTRQQWNAFKSWYVNVSEAYLRKIERLPDFAKRWPESSWKKYFYGFMVEEEKYFIYPYRSYSTNVSDSGGTHIKKGSNIHQVDMSLPHRPFFKTVFLHFSKNEAVQYDSFMEPVGEYVWTNIGIPYDQVEIDTQGIKPISLIRSKMYTITSRKANPAIRGYELKYRPVEVNFSQDGDVDMTGDLQLVESSSIKSSATVRSSISRTSYYAGMNLKDRSFLQTIIKELPILILRKLGKKIAPGFLRS